MEVGGGEPGISVRAFRQPTYIETRKRKIPQGDFSEKVSEYNRIGDDIP